MLLWGTNPNPNPNSNSNPNPNPNPHSLSNVPTFPPKLVFHFKSVVTLKKCSEISILISENSNRGSEEMDVKKAGSSLDSLVSSFNARITELQELVIGRNSEFNSTSISNYSDSSFPWITYTNLHMGFQCIQQAASVIYRHWTLHWEPWSFRCRQSRTGCVKRPKPFPKPRQFSATFFAF